MVITRFAPLALMLSLLPPNQSAGPADALVAARTLLQGTRPLEPSDLPLLREGLRAALAGKYLVTKLEAPLQDGASETEYQLDARGDIRFQRLKTQDPLTKDVQITVNEVTELPATLCRDRKGRNGRLGLTFNYWRGRWQTVFGRVHMATHEIDMLWQFPGADMTDGRIETVRGRRTRAIRYRQSPMLIHTFWVDTDTLLPVRYSMKATIEGKTHEVFETIDYPTDAAIERPAGLQVPDCV